MYNFLRTHKKTIVYLLSFYWFILLFLTSIPGNSVPSVGLSDKYEHFLGYFGLAFLLNLVLLVQDKFPLMKKYSSIFTFLFGVVYGLLDELHQLFIPGRSCDMMDWLADGIGVTLGIIGVYCLTLIMNRISRQISEKA